MANGEDTQFNKYRWMAVLQYLDKNNAIDNKMICSGTLITKRYVLTAAHCINVETHRLYLFCNAFLYNFFINVFK